MVDDLTREEILRSIETLYEGHQNFPHLHLPQHKLFTLASFAIQYLIYSAAKTPGSFIIRVEDRILYEKLVKRAKDSSTRNFLRALFLPRKLKYKDSLFFLDYFHMGTWQKTNEIPKEKIKGALIVKNSTTRPLVESTYFFGEEGEGSGIPNIFPPDFYYTSLKEISPKTLILAYGAEFEGTRPIQFPWIKKEEEKISGIILSKNLGKEIFK